MRFCSVNKIQISNEIQHLSAGCFGLGGCCTGAESLGVRLRIGRLKSDFRVPNELTLLIIIHPVVLYYPTEAL
jgi:hypothetical protein